MKQTRLNSHLHLNRLIGIVVLLHINPFLYSHKYKVFVHVIFDIVRLFRNAHLLIISSSFSHRREWSRSALQLLSQRCLMVHIHVCIANYMNELTWLVTRDVRQQNRQQRIGRDVERHAQTHIRRPLVHLTRQVPILHIKLGHHMTRRQSHLRQCARIPRRKDDAPIVRIFAQESNYLLQLIHSLSVIICITVRVGCAEVSPLETVDRT